LSREAPSADRRRDPARAQAASQLGRIIRENDRVPARVIVLAGPSGAGKSRLAERLAMPVLRLDDFYKSGDDPTLPTIGHGAPSTRLVPRLLSASNAGLTDWDHPDSWLLDDALEALERLCRQGSAEVPVYEIAQNGRSGSRRLDLHGSALFVAEGIFAPEVVAGCAERGLLAAAYCLRQHRLVTFWRRLTRDLREHRKPPLVLLRRGWALMREQDRVVAHAVARGCRPVTPDEAYADVQRLREHQTSDG
jgi:uridine kinase